MATTISVSPMTRVEGHLDIEVTVDAVGGVRQVIDAKAAGQMFRGFERILVGRDPRDAVHLTQRICGVCPISHAMASSLALEAAYPVVPRRTAGSCATSSWGRTTSSRTSCTSTTWRRRTTSTPTASWTCRRGGRTFRRRT